MQNLVAVGVADPGEQIRVGQRALDRVIAGKQPRTKLIEVRFQRLQATPVEVCQRVLAADQVDRGALLLRRLS